MIKDSGHRREYNRYHVGYRKGNITLLERMEKGHKWKYKCDCGYVGVTQVSENRGMCPECSRKQAAKKNTKHGEAPDIDHKASRLYSIWLNMKQRCGNNKHPDYKHYGGRGIRVCDEWKSDYLIFKSWALSNGYDATLSIDRINVDGNYCGENCRWADWKTQSNNKRNSRRYEYDGNMYSIRELAEMSGFDYHLIKRRLNKQGWSVEEAITIKPVMGNNQKTRNTK